MRKNYKVSLSDGGYTLTSRVNQTVEDIDARLDRLEKIVRAGVLDPAGVVVGMRMDCVEKQLEKARVAACEGDGALADSNVIGDDDGHTMPTTARGLRTVIRLLRRIRARLESENTRLNAVINDLRLHDRYLEGQLKTQTSIAVTARADANFAKEELRKFKRQVDTKMRQFVKETFGDA